jgi:hypothetical protein
VHDVDGFPGVQPDGVRDQPVVGRIRRVDREMQTVRIAKTVGPYFFSSPLDRHERIVVGNPVAAIVADRAGRLMFGKVGHNPEHFADQRIEALRIHANRQP